MDNPNNEKTFSDWLLDDLFEKIFFLDTQEIKVIPFSLKFFGEIGVDLKKGAFQDKKFFLGFIFVENIKKLLLFSKILLIFLK